MVSFNPCCYSLLRYTTDLQRWAEVLFSVSHNHVAVALASVFLDAGRCQYDTCSSDTLSATG